MMASVSRGSDRKANERKVYDGRGGLISSSG